MGTEMAYLIGMILGNGEIQQGSTESVVTIEIPHKNLKTEEGQDVQVYVQASLIDIERIIRPLLGAEINYSQGRKSTKLSFKKSNAEFVMMQILRYVGNGSHHAYMKMNDELFNITVDEKKSLLRGFADVTGYIRRSNRNRYLTGQHRIYLEIPRNWNMVIDIANLLKTIDIPVQSIDFGHPNFRDPYLKLYNQGNKTFWHKEHQVKIWANEFVKIGFNIKHKQEALEIFNTELLAVMSPEKTHRYYWETRSRIKKKPIHPEENSELLPRKIRGKHYDSWKNLAEDLGYVE